MPPISQKQNIDFEKLNNSSAEFAEYLNLSGDDPKVAFIMKATQDANTHNFQLALDLEENGQYLQDLFQQFDATLLSWNPELASVLAMNPGLASRLFLNPNVKSYENYIKYYKDQFENGVLTPKINIKGKLLGIGPNTELKVSSSSPTKPGELILSGIPVPLLELKNELLRIENEIANVIEIGIRLPPPNNISRANATLIRERFKETKETLLKSAQDCTTKIIQIEAKKKNYLANREKLLEVMKRKQRDDYYSQSINNQATSDKLYDADQLALSEAEKLFTGGSKVDKALNASLFVESNIAGALDAINARSTKFATDITYLNSQSASLTNPRDIERNKSKRDELALKIRELNRATELLKGTNQQKTIKAINDRKGLYDRKIDDLVSVTSLSDADIVKIQEDFVLPPYAIQELKRNRKFSRTTADKLKQVTNQNYTGANLYIRNRSSVLATEQLDKSKKPKEYKEFNSSNSNSQVNVTGTVPIVNTITSQVGTTFATDRGFVGEGFDVEYTEMVWGMVEEYKTRCVDADKKRIEIARIITEKKGNGRPPDSEVFLQMPFFGSWTIADEIKDYLETANSKEKAEMEKLRDGLSDVLLGEAWDKKDQSKNIKAPLLTEGIRLKGYLKALGYDDVRFDYKGKNESQDRGEKREAIFAPMQSATNQKQVYESIGRQHITNPEHVSQFAFNAGKDDSGNITEQIIPKGKLGGLFEEAIDMVQFEANGEANHLRTNTGFINQKVWTEVVSNPQLLNAKQAIEIGLRADMYRKYAEDRLKSRWMTEFENSYIQSLSSQTRYAGLSPEQIKSIVNSGSNLKNVRRDVNGNVLETFSNLEYLAQMTLESVSREYGKQIASLQQSLTFGSGLTDISMLDVTLLYRKANERFSNGVVTEAGLYVDFDKNNLNIKHQIESIQNKSKDIPGYYLALRDFADRDSKNGFRDINIALEIGKKLGANLLTNKDPQSLRKILPISNLDVKLAINGVGTPNLGPMIKYKECRALDYNGDPSHDAMILRGNPNILKVFKELEAFQVPSAHETAVLGELKSIMSPEMMKMMAKRAGKPPAPGTGWTNKGVNDKKDRAKDMGKSGDSTAADFTYWYKSWIPTEGGDQYLDNLIKNRAKNASNINILKPVKMIDSILLDGSKGFGWGTQLKQDFQAWTFGSPSAWIDPSRFINPLTSDDLLKARDKTGYGKFLTGIDNWKNLLDGARSQGGLWGHFMKTGQISSLEIPGTTKVILGNKIMTPYLGEDYEPGKAGINIITDMTGKKNLAPTGWVSNRLQYMVGLRKIENGAEVSSIGSFFTKKWDSWENGIDKYFIESKFGKALKLDKRNNYGKRRKQNLVKELFSLGFNIVEGSVEYVLVGVGKVAMVTPILGSTLKYIGERPAFVASVEGISGTFGALQASVPIARAISVGIFNTGLIGVPVYFIAGGGIPGVFIGSLVGGSWGLNNALNSLASGGTMEAIEKFMGFERLENPALMQSALANISDGSIVRTFGADGKTILTGFARGENTEMFQQALKWEKYALSDAGYVRWLSPHGWYGRTLTRVYNFIGGETNAFDNTLLAPYAGAGTGLERLQGIIGAAARGATIGTLAYLYTGNPLIGIGSFLGTAALENAATRMMPAIAVKLQFLGETAAGARIANALTRFNYYRVAFPLLDTIGLVQSTDFFNQALAIPTYQMLRGQLPFDVYAFGGTGQVNLWNMSLGDARLYGISDNEYYAALRKSEQTGMIPMHTVYYEGIFSRTMAARVAFNLGLGYIPMASAFSSRIYVLAEKLGYKSIWGTWYANKLQTLPDNTILGWMKTSRFGFVKNVGEAIDNPFGGYGGTVAKVGGTALGAFGGFELAISLGITNPVGIAAMTVAGAGVGFGASSLLARAGGFFYDNVLTGWLRTPLAAGGGLISLAAPLIGGTIGRLVAQIGGFGTGGYIAATLVGTVVGAILIPGIGGLLGVVIGSAVSAVASYGAAYVGDWIGNWWTKTTNFAIDSLKSISPVLALVRLFKAIDDADLGRFIGALMSFAMSFSVGMVTVGAVVSFVPPLITPAAVAPAATGGFFLPVGKLVDKTLLGYDKAKNTLRYSLNVNPAVVGIYNDTATITATDNPDDAATITFVTSAADSVCAGTADQFEISGKTIKLKDTNFDKARMQKSICVEYLVTPSKTLADYTQFCNTVQSTAVPSGTNTSGKEVLGVEQFVQCVNNKGISLGTHDLNDLEGQDNQTPDSGSTVPNTWGTGGFPVDPKLAGVVGVQCSFSNGTHKVIGALDIVAPLGTPVYSWADGKVIAAGTFQKYVSSVNGYYGQMVMVLHANNVVTWYAHLDSMSVKVGDQVKQGQPVGRMGHSVGNSNCGMGVHLHWEIRLYDQSVTKDPCDSMIDCSQYNGAPACFQPGYNSSKTGAVVSTKWFIDNLYTDQDHSSTCNINTYKGT